MRRTKPPLKTDQSKQSAVARQRLSTRNGWMGWPIGDFELPEFENDDAETYVDRLRLRVTGDEDT
jgi:hypothetical protein